MKKKKKRINEKRLAAYTAAAGAALVAGVPANAAISYTPADIWLSAARSGDTAYINIDGVGDWEFQFRNLAGGSGGSGGVSHVFYQNTGVSVIQTQSYGAMNLAQGSSINAGQNWNNSRWGRLAWGSYRCWYTTTTSRVYFLTCTSSSTGNFDPGNPGYLGIRFNPGSETKYGWIHIDSTEAGKYHINGWAYEDSGAAIFAGQTVVPEPTSLALFAAGAAALSVRRLRRKKK